MGKKLKDTNPVKKEIKPRHLRHQFKPSKKLQPQMIDNLEIKIPRLSDLIQEMTSMRQ